MRSEDRREIEIGLVVKEEKTARTILEALPPLDPNRQIDVAFGDIFKFSPKPLVERLRTLQVQAAPGRILRRAKKKKDNKKKCHPSTSRATAARRLDNFASGLA